MSHDSVILDSNLLVLLIVGLASRDYISKHRRLRAYADSDFDLLLTLISSRPKIIVTPNTLTETSNLVRYIAEPARAHICELFRGVVRAAEEQYLESSRAVDRTEFLRLGLADAALLDLASESGTLLTADLDLYPAAVSRGLNAENFNHYRVV